MHRTHLFEKVWVALAEWYQADNTWAHRQGSRDLLTLILDQTPPALHLRLLELCRLNSVSFLPVALASCSASPIFCHRLLALLPQLSPLLLVAAELLPLLRFHVTVEFLRVWPVHAPTLLACLGFHAVSFLFLLLHVAIRALDLVVLFHILGVRVPVVLIEVIELISQALTLTIITILILTIFFKLAHHSSFQPTSSFSSFSFFYRV